MKKKACIVDIKKKSGTISAYTQSEYRISIYVNHIKNYTIINSVVNYA
jgi:hypothetical protein